MPDAPLNTYRLLGWSPTPVQPMPVAAPPPPYAPMGQDAYAAASAALNQQLSTLQRATPPAVPMPRPAVQTFPGARPNGALPPTTVVPMPATYQAPTTLDPYAAAMAALSQQIAQLRQSIQTLQQLRARPTVPGAVPPPPPATPAFPPNPGAPWQTAADPGARPASMPGGPVTGTQSKNGLTLPAASGKATTFWNGTDSYKGLRDSGNNNTGAWGDPLHPGQFFCALPVGLSGGAGAWHNQRILVTNPANGKQVVLLVQDKGPAPWTGAAIDMSPAAKEALGVNFMDNINVQIAFAPDNYAVGPVT